MPVPTAKKTHSLAPRPAPKRHSPHAAELASCSKRTGTSIRLLNVSRTAASRHGRCGAKRTTSQSGSRNPARASPTAVMSCRAESSSTHRTMSSSSWPASVAVGTLVESTISPAASMTAARRLVPPISKPMVRPASSPSAEGECSSMTSRIYLRLSSGHIQEPRADALP